MYRFVSLVACVLLLSSAFAANKICIDPGHGGTEPGAVGCGQTEKVNNLNTSLKFRDWLNKDTADTRGGGAWSVIMTRTSDVYVSLQGRCDIANNNATQSFISIHNNAFNGLWSGTETYCHTSLGSSAWLRNQIQYRMLAAWGLANRGNLAMNFYVLTYTNMEAVLGELGFIDMCSIDATYTGNSAKQDLAAKAHMYALQNHYGLTAYTPGTMPSATTYTNDSPACSANWSTGTSATDKYGTNYRFRSTAAVSDSAAFSLSLAKAGTYDISAWWPAGTNRSKSAPYVLPNGGGTINANQQTNGGKWNLLRTQSCLAGTNKVSLSCWTTTGFIVVADAFRMYGPK